MIPATMETKILGKLTEVLESVKRLEAMSPLGWLRRENITLYQTEKQLVTDKGYVLAHVTDERRWETVHTRKTGLFGFRTEKTWNFHKRVEATDILEQRWIGIQMHRHHNELYLIRREKYLEIVGPRDKEVPADAKVIIDGGS